MTHQMLLQRQSAYGRPVRTNGYVHRGDRRGGFHGASDSTGEADPGLTVRDLTTAVQHLAKTFLGVAREHTDHGSERWAWPEVALKPILALLNQYLQSD